MACYTNEAPSHASSSPSSASTSTAAAAEDGAAAADAPELDTFIIYTSMPSQTTLQPLVWRKVLLFIAILVVQAMIATSVLSGLSFLEFYPDRRLTTPTREEQMLYTMLLLLHGLFGLGVHLQDTNVLCGYQALLTAHVVCNLVWSLDNFLDLLVPACSCCLILICEAVRNLLQPHVFARKF